MTKKSVARTTSKELASKKTKIIKPKTISTSKKIIPPTAAKKSTKTKTSNTAVKTKSRPATSKTNTNKRKKVTKTGKNNPNSSVAVKKKPAAKTPSSDTIDELGIVIVDDDIEIDQEKINEERRAYLEEARSQEAFD